MKPTYQIEYWLEVPEATEDSIEVHGKNNGDVASDNSLVIRLLYDLDEKPTTPGESTTKKDQEQVKTGDSMNVTLVMLLLSSSTVFVVIISKRKHND